MPTKFFLSKEHIKNTIIRFGFIILVFVIIMFFVMPYVFSSNRLDVFSIYYTIALLVGLGYWLRRLIMPTAEQLIVIIRTTCVKIGFKQEGVRLSFDDIAFAEIKENYFGRKRLHIIYNKEITYKIRQPFYHKMMFFFEFNKSRWSQALSVEGLSVEPEILVRSLNYHLDQYNNRYLGFVEQQKHSS
jgi:hypothetical protein